MTRTPTLPVDDVKMWRRLVARAHPDCSGEHELFLWTQNVREYVCGNDYSHTPPESEHRTVYEDGRIPFSTGSIFEELTALALERAKTVGFPYSRILLLLEDCYLLDHFRHEEQHGASYKRLAYIAHLASMSKSERIEWYRIAESMPLADRHAGHIIKRLKEHIA